MHRMIALLALIACSTVVFGQNCGLTPIAPNLSTGRYNPFEQIVGGYQAVPNSWPWQIVLCRNSGANCQLSCGGSIVAPNWIITAGHCVSGQTNNLALFGVKSAVHDQTCNNGNCMILSTVAQIVLHPGYNGNTINNDIALIRLTTPLTYGLWVQPVCLPSVDTDVIIAPNSAWTTGWGTMNVGGGGSVSQFLNQVNVPFVNVPACNATNYPNQITSTMVCAGVSGKDSCQGDSGGPLVVQSQTTGQWFMYGITSWGRGCANVGYPGVYARVTSFCDFIASTTNNVVQCMDVPVAPTPTENTRAP